MSPRTLVSALIGRYANLYFFLLIACMVFKGALDAVGYLGDSHGVLILVCIVAAAVQTIDQEVIVRRRVTRAIEKFEEARSKIDE